LLPFDDQSQFLSALTEVAAAAAACDARGSSSLSRFAKSYVAKQQHLKTTDPAQSEHCPRHGCNAAVS